MTHKHSPIIPTDVTGMLCPGCGYDMRGLNQLKCPECAGEYTLEQIVQHASERQGARYHETFRKLVIVPYVWFAAYFLLPLFHDTTDRSPLSFSLVFLNIPLQLVLLFIAYKLDGQGSAASRKSAVIVLGVLIAHIAIRAATSVWTEWFLCR